LVCAAWHGLLPILFLMQRTAEDLNVLLDQVRSGNEDGFIAIYQQNVSIVAGRLRRMSLSVNEVEDGVQEVFVIAFTKIMEGMTFDSMEGFRSWLRRVTYNYGIDVFRLRKRKPEAVMSSENVEVLEVSAIKISENPERELLKKEQAAIINDEIELLTRNEREAIVLHYFEELSYQEIADRDGLGSTSLVAIRGRLANARSKLKGRLSKILKI
jgi:RNA polymerase sigma factor (sigma-70 family)